MVSKETIPTNSIYKDEINSLNYLGNVKTCTHVSEFIDEKDNQLYLNPCFGDPTEREVTKGGYLSENGFTKPSSIALHQDTQKNYILAGPRQYVSFENTKVNSAILTCGGICPGLNVVIRELYMTLKFNYQVENVYGIKYGYAGIYDDPKNTWIHLNTDLVKHIHKFGGTILGSSRGGFDLDKIMEALIKQKIDMLFIIGGDGTHRGIQKIAEEAIKRKLKMSVCGIPKTIDNDIPVIDRTFGFETAVSEAVKVIDAAKTEADCAVNGVGIVKLFGRSCGFISLFATLASRDVNVCLIPEEKFELYGEKGVFEFVVSRVKERGHCVVVIAEGSGDALVDYNISNSGLTDKSGNKKIPVSFFLIITYFLLLGRRKCNKGRIK